MRPTSRETHPMSNADPASSPQNPGGVLMVRRSPAQIMGILVVCVLGLAVTLSAALRLFPGVKPGSLIEALMWASSLFLAWATLVWARMLFDQRPVIEIGPEGLLDRRLSASMIPWPDIAGMRLIEVNNQRLVGLDLVPGARERLSQSAFQRLFTRANERFGYGGATISATGLDHGFDAVVHALHQAWIANRHH